VHGPASVVRTLAGVGTAPLDITGRRNRVEATRRVAFPDNWNLHSVPRDVQVRLEVEGTKVVTLTDVPVRLRHEPGFASVSIEPKALAIDISGPEHIVAGIQSSDVKVLVDARGLPRGVHQLVPEIDVPAGVEIASIRPTRFTVTLE
jgi:YbbR domain-containing protein